LRRRGAGVALASRWRRLTRQVAAPDALSDVTKQKAQSRGLGFLHNSLVGRDRFELSTYGLRVHIKRFNKQGVVKGNAPHIRTENSDFRR
jgi:hypothetical protein